MKKKIIFSLVLFLLTGNLYANSSASASEKCSSHNPYHLLVNKQNSLPASYVPSNLVIPKVTFASSGNLEKNYMEATAAKALEEMFAAAKTQNIRLVAVSGYRSYNRQTVLYKNALATYGINQTGTAKPGQSEHQTGLAMDINSISQAFQYTNEGKWLAQNAHLYGFIIRYPKGKSDITGYMYEPWHIRYVGTELASYCFTNGLTLEEVTDCCLKNQKVEMPVQLSGETQLRNYELIKRDGVTYIKARDLMAGIHGHINFIQGILTLSSRRNVLSLSENSQEVLLNGQFITLSYPPILVNQSFYVPMRGTLKLLNYDLNIISGILVISQLPSASDESFIDLPQVIQN